MLFCLGGLPPVGLFHKPELRPLCLPGELETLRLLPVEDKLPTISVLLEDHPGDPP